VRSASGVFALDPAMRRKLRTPPIAGGLCSWVRIPDRKAQTPERLAETDSARAHSPLRRALRRRRDAIAARINAFFDDHDVVLTPLVSDPPEPIGKWAGNGPVRTFNGSGPYVGYTGVWNYAGNPAASIPAGLDAAGLAVAVQAVGAPGSETTLLALSAQLEAARPWAQRRPPVT
jgi:amidase